jgi:hypothetical protein
MANGRTVVHRRKHANRQATATARNRLPRKSSPEGRQARQDIRTNNTPKDSTDRKLTYTKPGSGNYRKVGR